MQACPYCKQRFRGKLQEPIHCRCGRTLKLSDLGDATPEPIAHYLTCPYRGNSLAKINAMMAGCGCSSSEAEVYHCRHFNEPVLKHAAARCLEKIAAKVPGYTGRTCRECAVPKSKGTSEATHPTNRNLSIKIPESGLISPSLHKIVQIEITNACPHRCSNCTRFVAHQRQPFFMDQQTFSRAVESVADHPGMIGIMGGEPTLHPDFDPMVRRYRDLVDPQTTYSHGRQPILDFNQHWLEHLSRLHHRRGLWTSLGLGYYRHFGLIQETFDYQCINDHQHDGKHQALLISWKDTGLTREDFEAKRASCWIQRLWSSSITPHGAYFCEVAAAIDHLFYDGKHAWPLDRDWWKRTPDDFGQQLSLCDHCSACLDVPRRTATDEIDDVSASNYTILAERQSPSVTSGRTAIYRGVANETCRPSAEWYMEQQDGQIDNACRISPQNHSIHPRSVVGITVCDGRSEALEAFLEFNTRQLDRLIVATDQDDRDTQAVVDRSRAELVTTADHRLGHDAFNKGVLLNAAFQHAQPDDWVLFFDCDILLPPGFREWFGSRILNPGCFYWTTRRNLKDASHAEMLISDWPKVLGLSHNGRNDAGPWGYFQLWHVNAESIRSRLPRPASEAFPTAGGVDQHFAIQWPGDKQIKIDDDNRLLTTAHLSHGEFSRGWNGRVIDPAKWQFVGWFNAHNHRLRQFGNCSIYNDGECRVIAVSTERSVAGRCRGIDDLQVLADSLQSEGQIDVYWRRFDE